MKAAEEDSTVDVGAARMFHELVDVVGFAIRGRPIAAVDAASAIADRERDSLFRSVEAGFAAEVERIAVVVEDRGACSRVAGMGGEQPTRHCRVGVFEETDGREAPERVTMRRSGRDDADAGLAVPKTVSASASAPARSTSKMRSYASCSSVRGSSTSWSARAFSAESTNRVRRDAAAMRSR